MKRQFLVMVVAVVMLAVGLSTASAGTSSPLQRLQGKRLAGTTSAWLPVASPFKHPADVAGTDTPPVQTNSVANTVAFFEFPSTKAASAFYRDLPLAARLAIFGVQQYRSLAGATRVPQPSRGVELRQCLWSGGPGQGGSAGKGTPSGGVMNAAGKCTKGTSSTFGVGIIIQRGRFVVLSESLAETVIGGNAPAAALADPSIGASKYAISALALMQKVGIKL
jgi:hypothetical protein